jgi:hypothetical protein
VHFFGGKFSHCGNNNKKKKPWVNYTKAVYEKKEKREKKLPFFTEKNHISPYIDNESPIGHQKFQKKSYFTFWPLANFGLFLLWMIANPLP